MSEAHQGPVGFPAIPNPPVLLENPLYTTRDTDPVTLTRRCDTCDHTQTACWEITAPRIEGWHICRRDGYDVLVYWQP